PDKRWGEAVRAICELHPGQTVSAEELIDFVGMRIARFKRPREVRFEPRLPRHEDGSLDREAVAQAHRAD
ncbi:MAG: long-chain fatty acid--CoA ligase, partial [Betaproteobacteria bacterium]|nr:long-chain fatty acid--CoA ligase [Betaproteobacteria bacterium]